MLTTKQRAALRSLASTEDTIMQVGKNGINENLIKTVSDALEARELIKMSVLENCEIMVKDAAYTLAEQTNAEVVAVIGRKFVLYRESKNRKRIEL